MQISFLLCLSAAAAFAPSARTASRAAVAAAPRMGALVPVDKPNKRLAAGAAGFVVGSMLGGPVVGAILAAGANQGSKVEGAAGDTFLTIGEARGRARLARARARPCVARASDARPRARASDALT